MLFDICQVFDRESVVTLLKIKRVACITIAYHESEMLIMYFSANATVPFEILADWFTVIMFCQSS